MFISLGPVNWLTAGLWGADHMLIKKGEIICIASGVFEGYDQDGPFQAEVDFDLEDFIEAVRSSAPPGINPWDADDLMRDIPARLVEQGLVSRLSCRSFHLGAFSRWDFKEEGGGS
ncbi:hypothetical protein SAMN05216605_11986 [Pseudomonas abietaniphila]|uniref:Uncharacterized protein n=2 Tax=Pseudomonas abietaniphila TaxID=89065 RepID=A0A1G8PRG7_9PSED|nr:hypothetical protein SAMN05216605_11986 [Pseudomonas abietaniphila]